MQEIRQLLHLEALRDAVCGDPLEARLLAVGFGHPLPCALVLAHACICFVSRMVLERVRLAVGKVFAEGFGLGC